MTQGSPPRMKIAGYFQESIRPFFTLIEPVEGGRDNAAGGPL